VSVSFCRRRPSPFFYVHDVNYIQNRSDAMLRVRTNNLVYLILSFSVFLVVMNACLWVYVRRYPSCRCPRLRVYGRRPELGVSSVNHRSVGRHRSHFVRGKLPYSPTSLFPNPCVVHVSMFADASSDVKIVPYYLTLHIRMESILKRQFND
jgi:hypothetical protein